MRNIVNVTLFRRPIALYNSFYPTLERPLSVFSHSTMLPLKKSLQAPVYDFGSKETIVKVFIKSYSKLFVKMVINLNEQQVALLFKRYLHPVINGGGCYASVSCHCAQCERYPSRFLP